VKVSVQKNQKKPLFPRAARFEVASVRAAAPSNSGRKHGQILGGPGSSDPGLLTIRDYSMLGLLLVAYNVKNEQLVGPSWIETDRYDIQAKLPLGATSKDIPLMLQDLLTSRFRLKIRRDNKSFDGYELVIGKGGSKLMEADPSKSKSAGQAPRIGTDGFPDAAGMFTTPKGIRIAGRGQGLGGAVASIESVLGKPVRDATGLTGKYNFNLTFSDEGPAGNSLRVSTDDIAKSSIDSLPDLQTAVQEQLGLKLQPAKILQEVIVVEYLDRAPAEN
jgi:uncharacterized protein (TIGR03435 family)